MNTEKKSQSLIFLQIIKITPRGFCKGVVDAWAITKKARSEYPTIKYL